MPEFIILYNLKSNNIPLPIPSASQRDLEEKETENSQMEN